MGELRRRAETAVRAIGFPGELLGRVVEERGGRLARRGELSRRHRIAHLLAHRTDLVALRVIGGGGSSEHGWKAVHPLAILGRKVRPAVEGQARRRQEDGQRPAAGDAHRLRRAHVDRVDVRSLLAIDLDADEELVHQ